MSLADTSRAQLRLIEETAFGEVPGAGDPNELRMTGESLSYSLSKETSKEIRSDRQTTSLITVGASAQGGVNFELSYNEYDALLAAALQGEWEVYGTDGVGTSFEAAYTANTITASIAPVGTSAFTTLAQGQWFRMEHPGNANDGKYFKVHETTAPTATVITLDAATPATVAAADPDAVIQTSRLSNGTTQPSFTIEKEFSDIAQFFAYTGMTVAGLSMGLQSGQIVNGSFNFMGKAATRDAATALPGTPVASLTYDVMNAVDGVGEILEGGSAISGTFIKSLTLETDNRLRGRDAIGTLGNVSIGAGTFDCKGSIEVYLADGTLYDKFLNDTDTSLSFRMTDAAGNGYIVTLPAVKYADAQVNAGAMDQDAMISMPFQAIRDTVHGKTIFIDRVGVAVA